MKRFISVSLLLVVCTVKAMACAIPATHNWYLFRVLPADNFSARTSELCRQNWQVYTDGDMASDWFDHEAVLNAARRKGDRLMQDYVKHLLDYQKISADVGEESWDYPTKDELASRRQRLEALRDYAAALLDSRLRSQHALLMMRCNIQLGDHEANIDFWEQTACRYIETVYRDMMRNIYACALLRNNHADEATAIYMEQGDVASLNFYYYNKRTVDDIRRIYDDNPDSPAMPCLLQDLANNAQETIDEMQDCNWPGKEYFRTIREAEAEAVGQLARRAVSDGKTSEPALWRSVEAWLQYCFGDRRKAVETINEACTLKGSRRVKENARVLRLYIFADVGAHVNDDFLTTELNWLEQRADEERGADQWYDNYFTRVYDRLVHQVTTRRFCDASRPEVAIALLAANDEMPRRFYRQHPIADDDEEYGYYDDEDPNYNYRYADDVFALIDTIPTADVERYLNFQPRTSLERWASMRAGHTHEFLHELLGTRYLRSRQATGADRQQQAYQLAVRYYQASPYGDAWYLTAYGKSTYSDPDEPKPDFVQHAHKLLDEAAKASDYSLRERAVFARAFAPYNNWHRHEWDDIRREMRFIPIKSTAEYAAMKRLSDFAHDNAAQLGTYVSRCDILRQFQKQK